MTADLMRAQNTLKDILLSRQEWVVKKLKMDQYALGNKAGAHLARKLKQKMQKAGIAHLKERKSGLKLMDPQKIADELSDFY